MVYETNLKEVAILLSTPNAPSPFRFIIRSHKQSLARSEENQHMAHQTLIK